MYFTYYSTLTTLPVYQFHTATDEIDGDASQLNNATYRPVNIDQTAFNMTFAGTSVTGTPAIYAWRDHGLGLGIPDPSVSIQTVDVPGEGRFVVGHKVTTLPSGRYRYDYAIFNLNSHRSMGGLGIPVYDGVSVTNIGFSDVNYHSGEVYDNTNWTSARSGGSVSWSSPQTFAQNANSNALRWGTMYNYWFEADSAPVMRSATMNLFRPGTPSSLSINVRVPACRSDFNVDGQLDFFDYLDFVEVYSANGAGADFNRSGGIDFFDYLDFVDAFSTGCN